MKNRVDQKRVAYSLFLGCVTILLYVSVYAEAAYIEDVNAIISSSFSTDVSAYIFWRVGEGAQTDSDVSYQVRYSSDPTQLEGDAFYARRIRAYSVVEEFVKYFGLPLWPGGPEPNDPSIFYSHWPVYGSMGQTFYYRVVAYSEENPQEFLDRSQIHSINVPSRPYRCEFSWSGAIQAGSGVYGPNSKIIEGFGWQGFGFRTWSLSSSFPPIFICDFTGSAKEAGRVITYPNESFLSETLVYVFLDGDYSLSVDAEFIGTTLSIGSGLMGCIFERYGYNASGNWSEIRPDISWDENQLEVGTYDFDCALYIGVWTVSPSGEIPPSGKVRVTGDNIGTHVGHAFSGFVAGDVTVTRADGEPDTNPHATYTLTADAEPPSGGYVIRSPDKNVYSQGEQVTLNAVANKGYKFVSWSGDLSGSSNQATFTMDSNKSVTANFEERRVYGVFVGINAKTKDKSGNDVFFRGGDAAENLMKTIARTEGFTANPRLIIGSDESPVNVSEIEAEIFECMKKGMKSGDRFVFYIACHGNSFSSYFKLTWLSPEYLDEATDNPGDEFLYLDFGDGEEREGYLTDDDLTSILSNLDGINKWIFLDSCHSGGFWADPLFSSYDLGDLEKLSDIGLLAASTEEGVTVFSEVTGLPVFGRGLEDAFEVTAAQSRIAPVTLTELRDYVASYVLQYYAEANLVCREQAFGDPVKFTPDLFNPVCYSSPDFTDGIGGGGSNQSVYFADPNLKSAVETALGVTDPNSVDMLWLTELWAREGGISDLSGLEYALNLTDLDLGLNSIIDLNPLAGMSSLRLLHLDNNAISDIGPLSDIAALESLWLGSNQIEDINDLTNLMNLQFLDLSQNPLSRESCKTHIPQIIANNPGIDLVYDGCEFECILTLSSTAGGTVRRTRTISYFDSQPYHITEPAPDGVYTYNYGEEQTFYALPDDGCDFIGWSGTLVDAGKIDPSSSSVTFTIDSDYTLIANFEGALSGEGGLCALTVSSSEGGSIRQTSFLGASPVPDGIYTFPCGAELDFSPVPDEGYWFDSWTGTLLDAGKIPSASAWTSVHFTLDGDYTLIANFIPIPPVIGTLTVSVSSSGGGFIKGRYIRGTQWGCSDLMLPFDGKYECREGGSFNLVPYAHPEYHFVEWTGSAVDAGKVVPASPGVKVIGVDDDYTIVANFEAD